jgi:hypothetical protein
VFHNAIICVCEKHETTIHVSLSACWLVEVELLVHKTFSYEKVGRWKEGGKFEWLKHMDRQTSLIVILYWLKMRFSYGNFHPKSKSTILKNVKNKVIGVCELYILDNAKSIWISNQLQGHASFQSLIIISTHPLRKGYIMVTLDKGPRNKMQWNQAFLLINSFTLVWRSLDEGPR